MIPTLLLKKAPIPKSIRELPLWFVTGKKALGDGGRSARWRYSPVTLETLRWDNPSDFTEFDSAVRAVLDHQRLDGVSFKWRSRT
jgi:hypothetical protein